MINIGQRYVVVFKDNRPVIGTVYENHSGNLYVEDLAGIGHVIPWDNIRELQDLGGSSEDGNGGPDDDDDDDIDDPDPTGYIITPIFDSEDGPL